MKLNNNPKRAVSLQLYFYPQFYDLESVAVLKTQLCVVDS